VAPELRSDAVDLFDLRAEIVPEDHAAVEMHVDIKRPLASFERSLLLVVVPHARLPSFGAAAYA
jgi:hypothetical protein